LLEEKQKRSADQASESNPEVMAQRRYRFWISCELSKRGDNMGMILKISIEPKFLSVCASGEFSLAEAKRTFMEVLDSVERHRIDKVLFDGREISGNPEVMERFYYGEFAANRVMELVEHGFSRAPQFAYVLEEPVLDPQRFGETVAVNRGMFVKTFKVPADAFKWLGLEDLNEHGPL
jgi:hypothetical protein